MAASRGAFPACAAVLITLLVHTQATVQPVDLAASRTAITQLQVEQHQYLNTLHETQDKWTFQKDANTLKAYAMRNLLNQKLAMTNARIYYQDLRERLTRRNVQLTAWNLALNNSIQLNEIIEKGVNQTNCLLDDQSEALDAQNVALLNDIGAYRTREDQRTFGLTLARQESVYRKLAEKATWESVEAESLAQRAIKEQYAISSHHLWGEKADLDVKNDKLEAHVPTLMLQRDFHETVKLSETYKKRNENIRRQNYADQVPGLESTRNTLFARLKRLRMDNFKLREHKSHLEMQRAATKQDLLLQKTGEIDSLLQKNAAEEFSATMETLYAQAEADRDMFLSQSTAAAQSRSFKHDANTDCQETNRELAKDNAYLTHQNNLLAEHCTGI